MSQVLMVIAAAVVLVGFPAVTIWAIVDWGRRPSSERPGGGGSAALGAAFQELDKLVARPSIEYVEEAKTQIVREEADPGGE